MEQLVEVERLAQVVGGAGLDGPHRRLDGAVGRHDDDGRLRRDGAQAVEEVEPGEIGHPLIGEDEVEGLPGEALERVLAAGRLGDVEAPLAEEARHQLALRGLVVHHEDPEGLSHPSAPRSGG